MALELNRNVTYTEVNFEPADWDVSRPDAQGCRTYTALSPTSSITITRSDGKTLDWDPGKGTHVMICENVVSFHADENTLAFH